MAMHRRRSASVLRGEPAMGDGTLRGVAAPEAANNAAAQTSFIPLLTPGFLPDR